MIQVPQSLVFMIPVKCVIRLSSGVVITFEKLFEQRTRLFRDTNGGEVQKKRPRAPGQVSTVQS